jgi:hypothetical protein
VIACALALVASPAAAQVAPGPSDAGVDAAPAVSSTIPEALRDELAIEGPDPRRGVWDLDPIVLEPPPYVWVPDPDLEPVDTSLPPPVPITDTGARTLFAIKLILGLVALAILAYLGGHRSVVRLQERLGIANVIAAGLPFVALGVFAGHPAVGILTGDVLTRVRPILEFGLGWLGFIIGAQLDIRVLDKVPRGTAYLITIEALAPFLVTAAACGAVMLAFGASLEDPALWRDLVLLGTAAAMTAPRRFRGFANRTWREGKSVDTLLGQLPDTAWLFVSLGLGVALGALFFAMVRVPVSNAEFLAVILGSIAFASGLAGYLGLSPIVICFIAGTLVINFPCDQRESIFRILNHLERPIHVLFLVVAGAVWSIGDWRGWVLVPLFVAARTAGKWLGVLGAHASVGHALPDGFADRRTLVSPLSSLSIALVVSVASLHTAPTLAWVTTAVIGGAFLIELVVQFLPEPRVAVARRSTEQPAVEVATATATTVGAPDEEIERPPMKPRPPTLAFRIEAATGDKPPREGGEP